MTTTHPSPSVEAPYVTYDLPTTFNLLGDSSGELQDLTNRLVDRAMEWKIISTEKSNTVTNSTNNISADISMNGQKLEEVTSFKYLEVTLCKDGALSLIHI